jgi:hypothetical protein
MSDFTREDLEKAAQSNVCTCFHFDLADTIEEVSDEDLQHIIDDPMAAHYHQQYHQPVSVDEFIEALQECTSYTPDAKESK